MNNRLPIWLVGVILLAAALPAAGGNVATDFALKDTDGKNVYLSDYLGKKVVVLNFWATWCVPCQQEMPKVEQLYEKYKDRGLVVLGIAMDAPATVAKVKPHAKKLGLTYPILLDKETRVASTYNPRQVMPLTIVIGTDKVIRHVHEGYAPGDEATLEKEVVELLGPEKGP
jgi:peroxiredoxin